MGGKKAPHNTYTSMEAIRKTQEERKYKLSGEYSGFKFHEDDEDIIGGDNAEKIIINYFKNNETKYKYNLEKNYIIVKKMGKNILTN